MDNKVPALLTLLLAASLVAALMMFQPYSADWPATAYTQPARNYLRAALQQDSGDLVRQSVSLSPVIWALQAAREHPDTLAQWGRRIQAHRGELQGDTAEVFVYGAGEVCGGTPIVFRFVGSGKRAKVLEAKSACLDSGLAVH